MEQIVVTKLAERRFVGVSEAARRLKVRPQSIYMYVGGWRQALGPQKRARLVVIDLTLANEGTGATPPHPRTVGGRDDGGNGTGATPPHPRTVGARNGTRDDGGNGTGATPPHPRTGRGADGRNGARSRTGRAAKAGTPPGATEG